MATSCKMDPPLLHSHGSAGLSGKGQGQAGSYGTEVCPLPSAGPNTKAQERPVQTLLELLLAFLQPDPSALQGVGVSQALWFLQTDPSHPEALRDISAALAPREVWLQSALCHYVPSTVLHPMGNDGYGWGNWGTPLPSPVERLACSPWQEG
ncbi:hypothetical protein P7K49_033713 [Saguinus oedipus]|uniref:Hair growth associated n=1 Tax=Saguinus oedipus TaxID=9490 RepID=A0ABQ9TSQ2_SAGOE|nr:hypothetical protein P7K49_033713 [Saguinus oedipus]